MTYLYKYKMNSTYVSLKEGDDYNFHTIALEKEYEFSENLKSLSPRNFTNLLIMAEQLWEVVEINTDKNNHNKYKKLLETEIGKVQKLFEDDILSLKTELEEKRLKLETIDETIEKAVETSLKTSNHSYEAQIEYLRRANDDLKKMYETLGDNHKYMIEMVEKNKTEQINKLENTISSHLIKIKALEDKYENKGSSIKGATGEMDMLTLIQKHTSWRNIEDTSKLPHSGDMRCNINSVSTMIEVKNYSRDVPTKEIVKFLRDMEENPNIPYGIFVSLYTEITGKRGTINIEWTNQGQFCVFVSRFIETDVELVFKFLEQCSNIGSRVYGLHHRSSDEELGMFKEKLGQIKCLISDQLVDINQVMLSIGHDRKILVDMITKQGMTYKNMLEKVKINTNNIIDIIMCNREEVNDVDNKELIIEEKVCEPVRGPLDVLFGKVSDVEAPNIEPPKKVKKKNK